MKIKYLLCAAAVFAAVACTKKDATPVDSALSLNPSTAIPLDSVSAAERTRAAAAAAGTGAAGTGAAAAATGSNVRRGSGTTRSAGNSG